MEIDILDNDPHPGHSSTPAASLPPITAEQVIADLRAINASADEGYRDATLVEFTERELAVLLAEIDRLHRTIEDLRHYSAVTGA